MRPAKLQELEAVLAIARRSSFRAAALDLGVSPTAVGNAVAALEDELGVKLFDRTTRRVDLTAAGHDYVRAIAPALADIHAATQAVRSQRRSPVGTLRINCSIAGGHQILVPFVTEFIRRYPGVKVDVVTEGRLVDIVHAGFDAGVRAAEAIPPNMAVVPLNQMLRYRVVGSPAYFASRPTPRHPAELMQHNCIRIRWPSGAAYEWEFARAGETIRMEVPWSLSLDNHGLMAKAAMAGVGLSYVAEAEVSHHIAAGRLVAVLDDWMPVTPGFCLYYPDRRQPAGFAHVLAGLIREIG
jgi:DNA-binding transcriptional LysR family regulator